MSKNLTEEPNEPRTLFAPKWARPALFISRAARTLANGSLVRISLAYRTCVLEPLAILDRPCPWRRNDLARTTPVVRARLHGWSFDDVQHVAPADEGDACGQRLVGSNRTLHSERRRPDSVRRPLQPWPEVAVL